MTAAYRWRRNELIDFAGAEPSRGFTAAARLSAGGVHVSRGRLAANDGAEVGAKSRAAAGAASDAGGDTRPDPSIGEVPHRVLRRRRPVVWVAAVALAIAAAGLLLSR